MTRAQRIEQCARELIAAIDRNLDTLPWPIKYGVPFGEALRLSQAIEWRSAGPVLEGRRGMKPGSRAWTGRRRDAGDRRLPRRRVFSPE
jgi:hypothetical protein